MDFKGWKDDYDIVWIKEFEGLDKRF